MQKICKKHTLFSALILLSQSLYAVTDAEIDAALNQHMGHYAGMVSQEYRKDHFDGIKHLVNAGKDLNEVAKGIMGAVNDNIYPSDYLEMQKAGLPIQTFQNASRHGASLNDVLAHHAAGKSPAEIQNHFATLNKPQIIQPGTPEYAAIMGQHGAAAAALQPGQAATLFEIPTKNSALRGDEIEDALIKKFNFDPYADDSIMSHNRIKRLVKDKKGMDAFITELDAAYKMHISPMDFLMLKEAKLDAKAFVDMRKKNPKEPGSALITAYMLKNKADDTNKTKKSSKKLS